MLTVEWIRNEIEAFQWTRKIKIWEENFLMYVINVFALKSRGIYFYS